MNIGVKRTLECNNESSKKQKTYVCTDVSNNNENVDVELISNSIESKPHAYPKYVLRMTKFCNN